MPHQQQFTFIDVLGTKKENKHRIKKHVSSDTNRRKRHDAVAKYQQSMIDAVNHITPSVPGEKVYLKITDKNNSSKSRLPQSIATISHVLAHEKPVERRIGDQIPQPSQLGQERLDAWNVYLSLLRNGESSPWRALRKQSSSMGRGYLLNTVSSVSKDIRVTLPCPTAFLIEPPNFTKETQYGLVAVKSFMETKYHSVWKHDLAANPYVYEHDYELGVFRECLYIAFDELHQGRASTGFAILNLALEAATELIKKDEPVLIFTLLDIVMDIRNLQDARLNKMLKDHITSLVATLLGSGHPLVMLLRRSISREQRNYTLSMLFQLMLDTNTDLFGANDFQTIGIRFGILQHSIAEGSSDSLEEASSHFEIVRREWVDRSPRNTIFKDVIAIEGAKLHCKQGLPPSETISTAVECALGNYEKLAILTGYAESSAIDDCSHDDRLMERLKPLGKRWLLASYHAMAIYAYTHLRDIFQMSSNCNLDHQAVSSDHFAARTIRILLEQGDARIG